MSLLVLYPTIAVWSDRNIHKNVHHLAATLAPKRDRLLAPVAFSTRHAPTVCVYSRVTAPFCVVYTKEKLAAVPFPSNRHPRMVSN